MKFMIFFALFCACTAFPQSYTPEVQAERQRFFQLFNKAATAVAAAPDNAVFSHHGGYQQASHRFAHQQAQSQVYTPVWTGPLASTIPAGLPGSEPQVRNTPEVEAAIADFNRAYNEAVAGTRSSGITSYQPHNTAHLSGARHNTGHYNPTQHNTGHYTSNQRNAALYSPAQHNHGQYNAQPRWNGPLASSIPAGLPGSPSQVADTPEVEAAKADFSRAYNNQLYSVLG